VNVRYSLFTVDIDILSGSVYLYRVAYATMNTARDPTVYTVTDTPYL